MNQGGNVIDFFSFPKRALATDSRPVDTAEEGLSTGGSGGGSGVEARIARLESDVEYIKRDIGELKSDFRDLRKEMADGFKELRSEGKAHFRWIIGLIAIPLVVALLKYIGVLPPSLLH